MNPRRQLGTAVLASLASVGLVVGGAVLTPDSVADDDGGAVALLEVPGERVFETHGNDSMPPPESGAPRFTRETAWPCEGDGTEGQRVQWVYAHRAGEGTLAGLRPTLEAYARGVQGVFLASAQATGGQRLVRYVTDESCALSILDVTVSNAALSSFDSFIVELHGQGLNRQDRVYQAWVESSAYCGIGTVGGDDRRTPDNPANSGPEYGRTDRPCWNYAEAHELVHNLGGVQNSAPNASGGYHCNDERDNLCYADGGPRSRLFTACDDAARDQLLDCGNDDYYAALPPGQAPTGYLASHWNVADSAFLAGASPPTTTPPTTVRPTTTTTVRPTTTTTTVGTGKTSTRIVGFNPERPRSGALFEVAASVVGQSPQCAGIGDEAVVAFLVSGREVDRQVTSAGVARSTLLIPEPGRYTIRAKYLGSPQCATSTDSTRKRVS